MLRSLGAASETSRWAPASVYCSMASDVRRAGGVIVISNGPRCGGRCSFVRELGQPLHGLRGLLRILHPAVPALPALGCSTQRCFGVAADVNWHAPRTDRPWMRIDRVEGPEVAVEAGVLLQPESAHGVDRLIGAATALAEGRADGVELLVQVAGANAENRAAI